MSKNIIKNKSFEFVVRIVNLYKHLTKEHREYVLSKQMLRSGTSVGAMVRESEYAESKKDFLNNFIIKTAKKNLMFNK